MKKKKNTKSIQQRQMKRAAQVVKAAHNKAVVEAAQEFLAHHIDFHAFKKLVRDNNGKAKEQEQVVLQ